MAEQSLGDLLCEQLVSCKCKVTDSCVNGVQNLKSKLGIHERLKRFCDIIKNPKCTNKEYLEAFNEHFSEEMLDNFGEAGADLKQNVQTVIESISDGECEKISQVTVNKTCSCVLEISNNALYEIMIAQGVVLSVLVGIALYNVYALKDCDKLIKSLETGCQSLLETSSILIDDITTSVKSGSFFKQSESFEKRFGCLENQFEMLQTQIEIAKSGAKRSMIATGIVGVFGMIFTGITGKSIWAAASTASGVVVAASGALAAATFGVSGYLGILSYQFYQKMQDIQQLEPQLIKASNEMKNARKLMTDNISNVFMIQNRNL